MQLANAPPLAGEPAQVIDGLRRLVHALRIGAHRSERELGVSGAQLFVLSELHAEPGASIRRLSMRTLTDPSSVSVVVARLVQRGLVTRRQAQDDARRSVLTVTSRGARLLARAPEPFQARLFEVLRRMPPARLRLLRHALTEIVQALDLTRGPAPLFFETANPKRPQKRRRTTEPLEKTAHARRPRA